MPIPQLKTPNKNAQSWRSQKKRYSAINKKHKSKYRVAGSKKNKTFAQRLKIKILIFILAVFLLGAIAGVSYVAWLSQGLPEPGQLINREIAQTTKIYDRTGETVLYEIHGEEQRTLVSLDEIPDYVKWATIAVEDKNFYKHKGFSLMAILRTAVTNVIKGKKAGGSTLTQQFIKNAVLTSEKSYKRKIKELILAYRAEKKFSKDEILQMYLNEIPYGSTAYGVEAASQRYFAKSVRDVNLAEAAILAALPQAPTKYSPYGSNKDLLIARQHYILDLMVEQGYINEEEAQAAKDYELVFNKQANNIIAPHFVMYVKEKLAEKYGEKLIEQGGLKIITTLDLYKQKIAEEVIEELGEKNEKQYQATNAALVSLDPKTGQVLAMVGSRDYFNNDIDGQVNVTTAARQPGSSIKPLVYAAAFIKGYTPNTILYDVVTNFSNDPEEPYEPHNYDDQEHGPVTITKALAGSLNIPAVKAIYLTGIDNVLELARELGYSTLNDKNRFGLSFVLGGAEVKLLEHANAFSAFAREGIINPVSVILKIEDKDGKTIEEYKQKKKKVLDANIAREINNILSDNGARAYAFGENNWLTLGERPVAAKTGTTNDYRDAWTIGYTPSIVTGVWVGNNNNDAMKRGAAGGVVAAPIWNKFMKRVLGDTPFEDFRAPKIPETGKDVLDGKSQGTKTVKIDKISGLLATEYTPPELIEEAEFAEHHSILYYIDKNDPLGPDPENPESDPQFELWETGVKEWAEKEGFASSSPPAEYDNVHIPENQPTLEILYPNNKQIIMDPNLKVLIKATAPRGVDHANYYINGNLLSVVDAYPFNLNTNIDFLSNGFHTLGVQVCDDVLNCSQADLEFNLILDNNRPAEEPVLSWEAPENGLAANHIDFPLTLRMRAAFTKNIAQINFYYQKGDEKTLIASIPPPYKNTIEASWSAPPPSGQYFIVAEAKTWQGTTISPKENIAITITNPQND